MVTICWERPYKVATYKHLQPHLVQFFPERGTVTMIDVSESCILAGKGDSGHLRIQGKEEIGVISRELEQTYTLYII